MQFLYGNKTIMKIFSLSDLHLGFESDKPMDKFGENWINHAQKIKENWERCVRSADIVLIPGDISWAMNFKQAEIDMDYLNSLPGIKYICRGNHDYWWSSSGKVNTKTGNTITALEKTAIELDNFIVSGTKGWNSPQWEGFKPSTDTKLYKRELERLHLALQFATKLQNNNKPIVHMIHFPPVIDGKPTEFAEILASYNVRLCLYGHLHGYWHNKVNMTYKGVTFKLVSADYLDFTPLDITTEVLR